MTDSSAKWLMVLTNDFFVISVSFVGENNISQSIL